MLETLEKYHNEGLLYKQVHPSLPLTIWNYTEKVQYEGLWDDITLMSRGLVTDDKGKFSMPAQNLLPDSVYSARFLGGMRGQNYLLEANGNWVPTTKEEEYRYREEGRPNEMVIFTPKTK